LYPTFLIFPAIKFFEIRQKLGREDIIVSEIVFTILKIACHIGSSTDFAITNENGHQQGKFERSGRDCRPMMISACLASKFAKAVCSSDDSESSETVDVRRIVAIFGVSRQSRDGNYP
jgi:hypothetical protein